MECGGGFGTSTKQLPKQAGVETEALEPERSVVDNQTIRIDKGNTLIRETKQTIRKQKEKKRRIGG